MYPEQVHILVSGMVQGVFFRYSTVRRARELGLTGWVRNLSVGRVEILSQGEKKKLEQLMEWSRRGPDGARVSKIDFSWEEAKLTFSSFKISW